MYNVSVSNSAEKYYYATQFSIILAIKCVTS